jgi:hypothetical protein
MKKTKKGQAALEFLTTYGWAFLIVLVMIGALAYFGVLDPSRLLPDKCVFGAGIGCQDFVAQDTGNQIRAQLINGFGYTINVNDVKIDVSGVNSPGTFQCCDAIAATQAGCTAGADNNNCSLTAGGVAFDWKADEMKEMVIAFTGDLKSSDRPRVAVNMNYTKGGSVYLKTISGVIQAKPN